MGRFLFFAVGLFGVWAWVLGSRAPVLGSATAILKAGLGKGESTQSRRFRA